MADGVSLRTLGRTLLARQHLLGRTDAPVVDVVSHLVGLQAQVPRDPYLALWSRVAGFGPTHLEDLYEARSAQEPGTGGTKAEPSYQEVRLTRAHRPLLHLGSAAGLTVAVGG